MNKFLLMYLLFCGVFVIILSLIHDNKNYFLKEPVIDSFKLKSYECGFEPFPLVHSLFSVHFFLIALLFLIFDLEIIFLLPWTLSLAKIGCFGFFSMLIFLYILMIGFIYEWMVGALEWD